MAQSFIQRTILIIGETGAGKSSLVNNLVFVLRFPTLEDAEKGIQHVQLPIPVYTEFKNILVVDGEDENETRGEACSRTRKPQIYRIKSGNVIINLIDTPGMADSEGQLDDEHVKNITACMYQCKQIHGILAVLKYSENTLNQSVKYTLNMVLSCLGKSAAKMVSFAITHVARNKKAIREYFNELSDNLGIRFATDNTYCFDSCPLFHVLSTQNGSHCDEVDRLFYSLLHNNNRNEMRRFFASVFSSKESYNILNVPTLIMAKQVQPALASLLPYLDTKDDEIKRDLKRLEEELITNNSQYSQELPRLIKIRRWMKEDIINKIIGVTPGQCFEAAKNSFNGAFDRYEAGASYLESASEIVDAAVWVCQGLVAAPKNYQWTGLEWKEEAEDDSVVKRLLKNINEERVKIKRMQSQKSTLYQKFQTEKRMLLDLLCDLISYLEEHAIVAYSKTEFGFSGDTAMELCTCIENLNISGQWNPTSKNIEPDELIANLSAMQDLEHFGDEMKKILLQCENFENINFRVVDILGEPNNVSF